jgi:hypothetical protein
MTRTHGRTLPISFLQRMRRIDKTFAPVTAILDPRRIAYIVEAV